MELKTKYYKKDILIVGFGKTGKSILKFFKNQKVNIFIYDDNLDNDFSLSTNDPPPFTIASI